MGKKKKQETKVEKSEKSPFVGYSVEDIKESEAKLFTIIAENDFIDVKGKAVFDEKTARRVLKKILVNCVNHMNGDDKKMSRKAKKVLHSLKLEPLRIH